MSVGLFINRVWPIYTSDIENQQHRSLLEHRQIGVSKSPMLMLSKIVVLLRPPNFRRYRGGWQLSNLSVFGGLSGLCFLKTAPHYSAALQ